MNVLLTIAACVAGVGLWAAKLILGKELHGQIERRIGRSVDATIASLPEALQAEWADEWLAELAAVIAMPLTAARYARGLRRSAQTLLGEAAHAAAGKDATPTERALLRLRLQRRRQGAALLDTVRDPDAITVIWAWCLATLGGFVVAAGVVASLAAVLVAGAVVFLPAMIVGLWGLTGRTPM